MATSCFRAKTSKQSKASICCTFKFFQNLKCIFDREKYWFFENLKVLKFLVLNQNAIKIQQKSSFYCFDVFNDSALKHDVAVN